MIVLVIGGAASGKSEFAEKICTSVGKRIAYVATMQPFGEEAEKRIARHLKLREGKGFLTVERYTDIGGVTTEANKKIDTLLIECVSNLCANEIFSPEGAGETAVRAVLDGVRQLSERYQNIVLVTNEIFSDGISYDETTTAYQQKLGEINCGLAKLADAVVEVVCGIPLIRKDQTAILKELTTE